MEAEETLAVIAQPEEVAELVEEAGVAELVEEAGVAVGEEEASVEEPEKAGEPEEPEPEEVEEEEKAADALVVAGVDICVEAGIIVGGIGNVGRLGFLFLFLNTHFSCAQP